MPALYRKPLIVPPSAIDMLGHVNNVVYLQWLLEVAVEHSVARGWDARRYQELGAGWVVGSHFLEYLRPAFEGEHLEILTWIASLEERRSLRRYRILRGAKEVLRAETSWAFVDLATGRPRAIDPRVAESFEVLGLEPEIGPAPGPCSSVVNISR